ncbi:tetraacyldisaccharide 4'-kinase [Salinisphaera hydrothermalis]|uniref:Tetraacyldisaccharide 4'-kinase n=1 Tax=Salinisphaera hydrothermalis (strain C41B8) TaxID=1304275 RepID=A0A084IJN0_SALHC|nr:tetraacyldisaccharide 4'-kinase [Salinisphaera hydrothermalis]KEZ76914.1 tetraacyldisaccharide 4'-kinase [Salinisphaera hydrothermalis C41B8]
MSAVGLSAAIQRRWYGSRPILALVPLAGIYGGVVAARRWAYRRGWLSSERVDRPVLVIGNISVGGSGKTPLTLAVIERARTLGLRPGVVSRGYGGRAAAYPLDVRPDTPAAQAGDEPVLIAQRSGVAVVVAPDRVAAARYLIDHHDVDLIIADDGLQHYRLQRDAEIAVVDARRGYGNRRLLPAGPLREPLARLARVDLECVQGPGQDFWLEPGEARCLADGRTVSLDGFRGQRVHAVAGIGEPARFFDMLEAVGLDVIRHAAPDHYRYAADDLDFADDRPVLMTEKDAVKCLSFRQLNLWAIPVTPCLSPNCADALDTLLRRLVDY